MPAAAFSNLESVETCWLLDELRPKITYRLGGFSNLNDHIELSGRRISAVIRYGARTGAGFQVHRHLYWPQLRRKPRDVRGYLKCVIGDDALPTVAVNGGQVISVIDWPMEAVEFDGTFVLVHRQANGFRLSRELLPSPMDAAFIERFTFENLSDADACVEVGEPGVVNVADDLFAVGISVQSESGRARFDIAPGQKATWDVVVAAARKEESLLAFSAAGAVQARHAWLGGIDSQLILQSPSAELNTAFAFAKIRAAESVFDSKLGLVHSPGGERYYCGVWANDQAEYAGPFFPFLGDDNANAASLNAYRAFAGEMNPQYEKLPYAFEVEGEAVMRHLDRGDAAMVAYGAARFALASGDRAIGEELWPLVEWCLEYCRRQLNAGGVIASESDELENRFPSGEANLSTSSLAYGALLSAAHLAGALGKQNESDSLNADAAALASAIERYFGATIDGFDTYRYYDGNTTLRAWVCLPLAMGITRRLAGTTAALFSPQLWGNDGLATEAGKADFWDRSTLYALRGVMAAGNVDTALPYLEAYTRRRLLGDHVPYAVEAFPEGNQAHLSAESALYSRIFIEGMFGIVPSGFHSFVCTPRLPSGWSCMALRGIRAFGRRFDVTVAAADSTRVIHLTIQQTEVSAQEFVLQPGQSIDVCLDQ